MPASVDIRVVMPIRGRLEQTVDTLRRMRETGGYDAQYYAVGGSDESDTLSALEGIADKRLMSPTPALTYWQALSFATQDAADSTYIAMVANDLLPCSNWLQRAADWVEREPGLVVGFNGDGYGPNHSCHFLISMERIRAYGGWPVWYWHNFGDTEIIQRATEEGIYRKHPYAILFHNHPIVSRAPHDSVYAEGAMRYNDDQALYLRRSKSRWSL